MENNTLPSFDELMSQGEVVDTAQELPSFDELMTEGTIVEDKPLRQGYSLGQQKDDILDAIDDIDTQMNLA